MPRKNAAEIKFDSGAQKTPARQSAPEKSRANLALAKFFNKNKAISAAAQVMPIMNPAAGIRERPIARIPAIDPASAEGGRATPSASARNPSRPALKQRARRPGEKAPDFIARPGLYRVPICFN